MMKDVLIISYNVTILVLFATKAKGFGEYLSNNSQALIVKRCVNSENCTTPDKESGECIRLNLCKPLRELIRKKPLNYNDRMFLRKSQCDYADGYPWVCCTKVQTTTRKPNSSRTTKRSFTSVTTDSSILLNPGQSVCGQPFRNIDNRIFGGSQTQIGEFPW